jgi:hypothetical protein
MADAPDIEAKPLPPCAACGRHHGSVGAGTACLVNTIAALVGRVEALQGELAKERADHDATRLELALVCVDSANKALLPAPWTVR